MVAADQDDLPQEDRPGQGCDPDCLCCRGGLARIYRTDDGWQPAACGLCGGSPPRSSLQAVLLGDRLEDLRQCCKAYKAQLALKDPLRTFTLKRAQGLLQDMLDLEAGRATRSPVAHSEPLDANALNEPEVPHSGHSEP